MNQWSIRMFESGRHYWYWRVREVLLRQDLLLFNATAFWKIIRSTVKTKSGENEDGGLKPGKEQWGFHR